MDLLVAADDRTGAFESAAVLADNGAGCVPVVAWPSRCAPDDTVGVIDLGSRHLLPADAASRAASLPAATRHAHKIDSTLRGNWAEELVARAWAVPVLLVPALPAIGRTCDGGVVLEHGRPVHEGAAGSDVRRPVWTSRPDEMLTAADAGSVRSLPDVDAVREWLGDAAGIAVADAHDEDEIERIVAAWADGPPDVVLAGTSVVVGSAATVVSPSTAAASEPGPMVRPIEGPILVVCGSVHPAARRQVGFAEHRGVPVASIADDITARELQRHGALVLVTEIPVGDVSEPMAIAAATSLARGATDLVAQVDLGAMVVIGGDTATAVLGDTRVRVLGSLGPGEALVEADRFDMPIVTRSGGFGPDHALVDLLSRMRGA